MTITLGKSSLPDGLRVYAVGDVHGCIDPMNEILAAIEEDLCKHPVADYRIVFLGDYLDRGPASKAVVYKLFHLQRIDPRVICLRGNHDETLHNFLHDPLRYADLYFYNGGAATLRAYGLTLPRDTSTKMIDVVRVADYGRLNVPLNHLKFLATLPLSVTYGDYFFCHAGVRPGVPLDTQTPEDLMWIRADFLQHTKPLEKVIVHGHTPVPDVEFHTNRIAVDTRCYATGRLSCLVLEGADHRLIQTAGTA